MLPEIAAVLAGESRWAVVCADNAERLEAESKGLSLRDARAGQQSLFGGAR